MKRLSVAVAVLGIATLCSVAQAQFTPQWHVGDWWIVKQWSTDMRGGWQWQTRRYDVLGVEKVGRRDCFVLQEKLGDTTPARDGVRSLYDVRTDDWKIVREVFFSWSPQGSRNLSPDTLDCLQGMFGPICSELRLPLFPLDTVVVRDSTFRLHRIARSSAYLRQFSGLADSALLNCYRSEPDTSGGRPIQPRGGTMFAVLSELGAPCDSRDSIVPRTYSLQLWSGDHPWRLYEESGQYAPGGARWFEERSWLIRSGRSGR